MIDEARRGHAEELFYQASRHQYALEKLLPDATCADELVGFHACQTVRNISEAVLCLASVPVGKGSMQIQAL